MASFNGVAREGHRFCAHDGGVARGHASLIRLAKSQSELVVVSILVNPTQFNDAKDFETYPRTLEGDMDKAQAAGADAVFAPSAEALYGGKPQATPVHWGPHPCL